MIILPFPSSADVERGVGISPITPQGQFLRRELIDAGIDMNDAVVTHVCRFALPDTLKNYKPKHFTEGAAYVHADIMRIQPDAIICVGAQALKCLYGSKAKLDTYRGNVLNYEIGDRQYKVIPTASHLQFLGGYANLQVFQSELRRAAEIARNEYVVKPRKTDYRVCTTADEVEALCAEITAASPPYIAFDTEWGNDVARNEFRYTISIQLSWAAGKAAFIQLRNQRTEPSRVDQVPFGVPRKDGTRRTKDVVIPESLVTGVPMHTREDEQRIWSAVQRLLMNRKWKVAGQHIRADAEEFARAGYPIDERVEDGIDTMLIHHQLFGDEDQGLDHLIRKYAPEFGAFWMDLEEWLDENTRKLQLQFGYRTIPLPILIPYACCDADGTWIIAGKLLAELQLQPTLWALYWKHVAPTSLHLLDVERQGIMIDNRQRARLYEEYKPVYDDTLAKLRTKINWPDFNPGSDPNKQTLMYSGSMYKDKKAPPEGAHVLKIVPLMNTDKFPKDWAEIEAAGDNLMNSPSTKAKTIELLIHKYPEVIELRWLKLLSVLGKFLGTYLQAMTTNEFGVIEDGKGLHNNIWSDGRVRTKLSQITETGRYTSKEANLQTKPKKQEAAALECMVYYKFQCSMREYEKRCRANYTGPDKIELKDQLNLPKFATCFIARPGYCLIEADFKTAELFIWAYCSGDPELIAILDSGRDLHSEVAALAFDIESARCRDAIEKFNAGDKETYKAWNKWFKDHHEAPRTGAKTVNFGVMYGRGAGALAREIQANGVDIDLAGAQRIIDRLAKDFPIAWKWLQEGAQFAVNNGYIENAFGRRRYFSGSLEMSNSNQAAIGREAKNSRIQGAVADLLAQAGVSLYRMRRRIPKEKLDFEVLLPVHDAFLFEVKYEHVENAVKLINMCMSDNNLLPGTKYKLGLDIEVRAHSWGDKGIKPKDFIKHVADAKANETAVPEWIEQQLALTAA